MIPISGSGIDAFWRLRARQREQSGDALRTISSCCKGKAVHACPSPLTEADFADQHHLCRREDELARWMRLVARMGQYRVEGYQRCGNVLNKEHIRYCARTACPH